MWEAFLDLFRNQEKIAPEPAPARSPRIEADYQICNIRADSVRVYEFEADLVHKPSGDHLGVIRGDSETELRRAARTKARAHAYRQEMNGKTLDL